jgi:predicted Zn-dependent protease
MKRVMLCLSLFALAASAQFGGLGGIGKIKDKLDEAKNKAKPATDRAQKAADTFTAWTPEEEESIGGAGAAKMIAMFGLVDNEKAEKYVNLVGASVAQFASRPMTFRFAILDSEIAGAFALPGGYIFITRGAVTSMKNEAQLAGALGHEVIHAAERHLEKEIRGKKTSSWAIQEGMAANKSGDLAKLKADAFLKDLFTTSLSRDKEDAADQQGMQMAVKAGYAAGGLMEFLDTLKGLAEKPENQQMFGQLLSTHPPFDSRIAKLRPVVEKAGAAGATLEARFQASLQ